MSGLEERAGEDPALGDWRRLPVAEQIHHPGFVAYVAASRVACGLPPKVTDPVTISRLVDLMTAGALGDDSASLSRLYGAA